MKKTAFISLFILFVLLSCGGKYSSLDQSGGDDMKSYTAEENEYQPAEPEAQRSSSTVEDVEKSTRKVIKDASLSFGTKNLEEAKNLIYEAAKKCEAYISRENMYTYSDRKQIDLVLRVPSGEFDSLLSLISAFVKEYDRKDIEQKDVTEEYLDIEARIKTKKELEARYKEILKKANSVKDILEIEQQIGNLREEIESIEGRLKYLSNQVAFSTLNISVYESFYKRVGFFSKIVDALQRGWQALQYFIIGLVYLWPFGILAYIVIVLIRRYRRRRKARKMQG